MNYYTNAEDLIEQFIVQNGNNEITADVLRPVLLAMLNATRNTTGLLDDLATTNQDNLVAAINELAGRLDNVNTNQGVQIYFGINDPSMIPPDSYKTGDFYMQQSEDGQPIQLWQFNGFAWVPVAYGGVGSSVYYKFMPDWNGSAISVVTGLTNISVVNQNMPGASNVTFEYSGSEITITDGAVSGDQIFIIANKV